MQSTSHFRRNLTLLDLAPANLNRSQPAADATIYRETSDQTGMGVYQNCTGFFQSLTIEKVKRSEYFVKQISQ